MPTMASKMAKRKAANEESSNGAAIAEDSGSDEDFDILNVDFEWFDPQPEHDFHGIKSLLQQLFDIDAHLFELPALTDLILAQPLLGSTVKVGDEETQANATDPYAFLSVINLQEHQNKPFVLRIIEYLKQKAAAVDSLSSLSELISKATLPPIGLILTERLINVPAEVTPPMYTMLLEEINWALDEKEPYNFSHYLILSKTYTEIASKLDTEDDRPKKKNKAISRSDTFYFHPEDEIFQNHAICQGGYDYTTRPDQGYSDSKRAFQEMGVKPQGHLILIEAPKFPAAVQEVARLLKPS